MKKILLFLVFTVGVLLLKAQTLNLEWAKNSGGGSNDVVKSIAIGKNGVYTTGSFQGIVDFDPGPGVFNLSSAGESDIFISKLDAKGNFVWAKGIGGKGDEAGNAIVLDEYNGLFITGYFHDTVDFNPDTTAVFNLSSAGLSDIFVFNLDTFGNFLWAKRIGGDSVDIAASMAKMSSNSSDLNITGSFSGTVDFHTGAGVINLTSAGGLDAFILKLDNKGNYKWVKRIGGTLSDQGRSIVSADWGDVYSCGSFQAEVDLDPNKDTLKVVSKGSDDMFFVKISNYGSLVWARQIGGRGSDIPVSMASDYELYITGLFHDTVVFRPQDPNGPTTLISNGLGDIFIAHLDRNSGSLGNFAIDFGGAGEDAGLGLINIGEVTYATGAFNGVIDFDPGTATYNLSAGNSSAAYIIGVDDYGRFMFARQRINGASGNCISMAGNNNIYMAGSFSGGANNSDMFINKYSWNPTGGIENIYSGNFSIYPNPTNGLFNVDLSVNNYHTSIEVFNHLGVLVYKKENADLTMPIDIGNFADGLYMVKLRNDKMLIGTRKFVKF